MILAWFKGYSDKLCAVSLVCTDVTTGMVKVGRISLVGRNLLAERGCWFCVQSIGESAS